MRSGIYVKNIWFDNDMIELKITVENGESKFVNRVYVGYKTIDNIVNDLNVFKNHVYGGLYDIEIGKFGPEYAKGAFWGRLHFQERGKIYISIRMQSEFYEFGKKKIASEVYLYLLSEPALLDNFISQLTYIHKEVGNTAILECLVK